MQNIKIGTPVYHYLNMSRVGIVVDIQSSTNEQVWFTEGTPSQVRRAVVEFPNGQRELLNFSDLMRADLD